MTVQVTKEGCERAGKGSRSEVRGLMREGERQNDTYIGQATCLHHG
jgi:hypothetical protein